MLKILCVLVALISVRAYAEDMSVVDVRRNITLADQDTVYKDFYIHAGPGSGLKKNLVVTAVRKISIRDASGSQAYGEILVPVGQLKIIAIFDKIAVAREYKLLSRDELPMLEQVGIMTGDKIDLQGSFIDNSKPKHKASHSAEQKVPTETLVVTTLAAPGGPSATSPLPATAAKSSGPAPASVALTAPAAPLEKKTPPSAPTALPPTQKLEKSADSGNNTAL